MGIHICTVEDRNICVFGYQIRLVVSMAIKSVNNVLFVALVGSQVYILKHGTSDALTKYLLSTQYIQSFETVRIAGPEYEGSPTCFYSAWP
jgi:hypothetical protein